MLYGAVTDGSWYVQLMRDKVDVAPFRDQIVFGRGFAEQTGGALQIYPASLPEADCSADIEGLSWQAM
jgi:nitrite reductase (NADH) large subunit